MRSVPEPRLKPFLARFGEIINQSKPRANALRGVEKCEDLCRMRSLGPALLEAIQATSIEAARSTDGYDAIVVGSGATGGLAALLLTEAGLRVLVLDAGASRPSLKWAARGFAHRAGARILRGAAPRVLNHILSTSCWAPRYGVPPANTVSMLCLGRRSGTVRRRCPLPLHCCAGKAVYLAEIQAIRRPHGNSQSRETILPTHS